MAARKIVVTEAHHRGHNNMPLPKYIAYKAKMLQEQFMIELTKDDISEMQNLKSEDAVDAYVYRILRDRL